MSNHPENHPEEQLSAYLDGELNEEDRLLVESHLKECPDCRMLAEDLLNDQRLLFSAFETISPPDDLEASIAAIISKEAQPLPVLKRMLSFALSAISLFAVIGLIMGAFYIKMFAGAVKLMKPLLFLSTHMLADMPLLLGVVILFAVAVLALSAVSLHRLLRTTTS
ncbi:zf-HC2 domain-containing protein [Paenibacillus sp. HN-1]|uniref:anti-sigma factor family protein n=1 Tax=Paenibacillus TaxID=44249 RepID=UPI001CA87135|nr:MULTISPECIES: zf-HC2 domain-containing protein [Paenibacillus]MBY9079308.1 zf-HC2 domain-containing protein [Paenibacillus sp. CGMCC 1.18879]MBY9087031.1 zf-HC2 domain-containing protein [Paenibacillus sinensis]